MRFLLVIFFLMVSVMGLHFSGIDLLNEASKKETPHKKLRAVKPRFLQEKTAKVPPATAKQVYSFFETLNDPTLTRYIGLNGKLLPVTLTAESKEVPVFNSPPPASVKKSGKPEILAKTGQRSDPKRQTATESEGWPRYAVQVSSFRSEELAGALKMRLQKKGFDAFLVRTELGNNGGTWHRVFLGRYSDGEKAQEAARIARSQYKLNAVVVRNTNQTTLQ